MTWNSDDEVRSDFIWCWYLIFFIQPQQVQLSREGSERRNQCVVLFFASAWLSVAECPGVSSVSITFIFLLINANFLCSGLSSCFISASIPSHIICPLFVALRHSHKRFIGLQLRMMFCHYDFMRNVAHVSYTMCWMMIDIDEVALREGGRMTRGLTEAPTSRPRFCGGLDLSFTSWVSDWDITSASCGCTYNLECVNNCNNCLKILNEATCSRKTSSHHLLPPGWWNVRWSFTVDKSFLEHHN